MSYTRKFKRNYDKVNDIAAEQPKSSVTLSQRIVAAVTAAGFVLNPMAAMAAIIDSNGNRVEFNKNNVADVWAQKVINNQVAVNQFKEFGVDANQIANMYFKAMNGDVEAQKLFNFVDTRININGMVNAIRDSKVGGDLYFLSPDGMAVGAKGVINTGSLYVMTPSIATNLNEGENSYNGLKGAFVKGIAVPGNEAYENVMKANIPMNSSGTITVLGRINAAENVGLYAPKIAVGKNVSGKEVYGTAKDGIVKDARINAGVVFNDIVNTNVQNKPAELLGKELVASVSNSGDIVLAAKAESEPVSLTENPAKFIKNGIESLGIAKIDIPETITASVENYGTLEAGNDVILTAKATNGNKDLAEELLDQNTPAGVLNPDYVPVPAADSNRFAYTEAKINVQGDIKALHDVEISANANNTFVDGTGIKDDIPVIGNLLGTALGGIEANVMLLGSDANVNIGKDAAITAGGYVDINAESVLDGTLGAAASSKKLISLGNKMPATGVTYAGTENKANVTIAGTIHAKGESLPQVDKDGNIVDKDGVDVKEAVNIGARAETNIANDTSVVGKKPTIAGKPEALLAAIAVTEGSNVSEVKIAESAKITSNKGDVKIAADTFNQLTSSATSTASDKSLANVAMNYFKYDSSADVIIAGDVNAAGNLALNAVNTMDENTVMANNTIGMGKLQAELMGAANIGGITGAIKDKASGLVGSGGAGGSEGGFFSKITGALGGGNQENGKKTLDQLLSAGASIAVADETNTANITINKTADLTAGEDLTADAQMNVVDVHMTAIGKTNSYKDDAAKNVAISAGVLYAEMDNSAGVTIEDGTGSGDEEHAQLKGKNINLNSATTMTYNRVDRLIREIDRSIEKLNYAVAAIKSMSEDKQAHFKDLLAGMESLQESLGSYAGSFTDDFKNKVSSPDSMTVDGTINDILNNAGAAFNIYSQVTDLQQNFGDLLDVTSPIGATVSNALGVVTAAVAFTDPANYANFSAGAGATAGDQTKLSASGAVSITDLSHNSNVAVGRYAQIDAVDNVDIKSSNSVDDVNVTGKQKFWKLDATAGGGVGVGGSFNYQNFDTDSKVTIAEGAAVNAGDIDIASDSDIFHVGVMLTAGKSDGSALSGMGAYTDSDSINGVYVDDEAVLNAKKDKEAGEDANKGAVNISAANDTSVTNAIMALTISGDNAAVGGSVAINDIDVQNIAAMQDIDKDLGGSKADLKGEINASALKTSAETTGLINTVTVAGGVTSSGKDEPAEGDSKGGVLDKIKGVKDSLTGGINKVSGGIQNAITNFGSAANSQQQGENKPAGLEATEGNPSATFAGAGSVSLNMVKDTTKAVIDGANINLTDEGKLTVGARDTVFIGAWSGAAAMSFRKGDSQGTSVAISGAAAANDIDNEVTALVKNSTITGVKDIDVTALSGGSQIAAGIGATVMSSSSGGKNVGGGANISLNLIEKDVNANMDNVSVTGDEKEKADIDVTAYESDVQVTGGVNANIATGGGTTVGGSISVADITNKINAGITGGTYTNVDVVNVNSLLATTQVTAAVSAGVATGGSGTNNSFSGAVIYNGINNNLTASIDGDADITANAVNVIAKDTDTKNEYQKQLGDYKDHNTFAEERGIDIDGSSFYKDGDNALDMSATAQTKKDANGNVVTDEEGKEVLDQNTAVDLTADKGGSTIVNAAFVVAGSSGNASGAAVNIADIDNKFNAKIDNAAVKANIINAAADADTLIVNAAGGVAVGSKTFGGMGSVTWQTMDNDITATMQNSRLTADTVNVKADNDSLAVNVAGQVAYGKSAGVGAALAYNALNNTTGAYMYGNDIDALDAAKGVEVNVNANNTSDVYGVGASIAASTKAAVSGTVVINRGGSNTEAIVDEYNEDKDAANANKRGSIKNANKVNVTANDATQRMAVVGNVSGSGKVAAGAGVAYNDVGGSSADADKAKQNTKAAVNNTDITTVQNAAIDVKAEDVSELTTIGIGIGGGGTAAVQGAAATALINKNVAAEMHDTNIDNEKNNNADVNVKAESKSDITTNASVVAVSKNASVGAGVAVNRSNADVNAVISGGKMNVNNLRVDAQNTSDILTIGIGGGVAAQGAGITGSVAVNQIGNNTTAKIAGGANITADNNVIVDAISDEQIANYAGSVSVAGQGAAVGVSVSVNQIDGTTNAAIGDEKDTEKTSVTALGKGDKKDKVSDEIAKGDILDAMASEDIFKSNDSLGKHRTDSEYSGIAVSASSTHDIKSFLVNAGVAGQGAAVNGTVNVNQIGGVTTAAVKNAKLISEKDINVAAHDYSNSAGLVGTASVAGQGAGIGMGSDTALIDGAANAVVDDSELTADGKLAIDAASKQGIASLTVGAAVAGMGAGVAGVVTVTQLENATKAQLTNSKVTAGSLDVTADHYAATNAGNVGAAVGGIGAGVGLSVGVLKDNSTTEVNVGNDESDDKAENTITVNGDVNIKANNLTKVAPTISATGVGGVGAGVAGATSVNNINSTVKTNINNVAITSENGSISADAHNEFTVDAYVGGNAAGAVGVGASVTVNTIDSTVQTNADNSNLTAAKDIELTASEKRTITQLATNAAAGAAAAGANIAITTVGKKIDTSNENGKAVGDAVNQANGVYGDFDLGDYTYGKTTNAQPSVGAELGGDKDSQIAVNVNGGKLAAGNDVTAKAEEFDNITMTLGSGAVGGAAVNAGVGILDVHRNVGVNVRSGAAVTAGNAIDLGTKISGSSELNIYQGTAGLIGVNGAYGEVNSSGTSQVTINGGSFTGKNIAVNAIDAGRTSVEAIGITAGVVGVGGIVANGSNTSETTITVNNTSMTASDENIDIHAERKAKDENGKDTASLDINAIAGSGGLLGAGAGLGALANEMGKVGVIIGSDNISGNSLTAAKKVNVTALNAPLVNVSTTSAAGSLVASAAVTYAKANIGSENNHMETYVTVGENNTFAAGNGKDDGINIEAKADAKQTVDMKAVSVAIGGAGQANAGEANVYSDVTVTIADKNTYTTFDKAKADEKVKAVDVNINGVNNVMQNVTAEGTAAGGYFASGTNLAWTDTHLVTNLSANGSTENSAIGDLTVKASSKADSTVSSDGSGGALVDISPYAARSENNIDSKTNVNIAGNWNIAGNMKAEALHENAVKLTTNAVKASAVGLSGVHSENNITNATSVNYDKATVTTGGDQDITARNTIDYTNDTEGSGYGVAQGAAVWAEDDMDLTANVNITESTIKAKGAITAEALTGDAEYNSIGKPTSSVNKEVTIKSAGVVAGTYAESTDDIDFTNTVNVGAGSTVATIGTNKDNADITLTAADRTNYTNVTTADTQGGVVGAAGTKLTNNIDRNNTITIAGTVDSNYDANLDAGDSSKLNLTLKSNAYNKTAAPIATVPSISGKMNQTSTIDIQSGSTIRSLRDINAAAGVGDTTIAKESKTWRWVDGGETGTGSIASTSDGTFNDADGTLTTSVTVNGTLEAGKNHELDITIDSSDEQKNNLKNAIDEYGNGLKLEDLKGKIDEAQKAFDEDADVKALKDKSKELDELSEKYQNNKQVWETLNQGRKVINDKLNNANKAKSTAEENLSTYIKESCAAYNKANNTNISVDDFKAGLTDSTKDWYNDYHAGYDTRNSKVTKAAADVTKYTEKLERKNKELEPYSTDGMPEKITQLQKEVKDLQAGESYKQKLNALQTAQENYNKALQEGVTADVVNAAIFKDKDGNYVTVKVSDWYKKQYGSPTENIGMQDYAASLLSRFEEITNMMQDYTGTDVSAAYSAEMQRIQGELKALGIGSTDANGNFVIAEGSSTVPTIELKDLMVSGGNVNITGDTLSGKGNITAHGKPSLTVTNNTDFFLRVNDVIVDSDGGNVRLNNAGIASHDNLNIKSEPGDSVGGNNAQITIKNTTSTKSSESNIYTPDIGVYGTISNPFGNITIENSHNSIYVAGDISDKADDKQVGSIKGRTINLVAGGSVTQGYSDGIHNVNGDPQNSVDKKYVEAIQKALIEKLGDKTANGKYYTAFKTVEDLAKFIQTITVDGKNPSAEDALETAKKLTGQIETDTPGIAAGGAIYINAASINVNGTIQSGYEDYKLQLDGNKNIGEKDHKKSLQDWIANWQKTEDIRPDSEFKNDNYLVTDGTETGAVYDKAAGKFVYKVRAWYNPTTNQIFTEDIDQAGGGRIYLTGAIANTNASGGKLSVLDGGSNYAFDGSVNGSKDFTFKLGSINAETVEGRIEINDTNTGNTVIYSRDEVTTIGKDGNKITADNKGTYDPVKGQYFNWSNGEASRVITEYKNVTDSSWFGLDEDNWKDKIGQLDQVDKESMKENQTTIGGMMDSESSMITDGKVGDDYKYTGVDGSSEKSGNENKYQITFQRQGKPKQAVDKDGNKLYLAGKDDDGNDVFTTDPSKGTPYYLKDENGNTIYEVEISTPVTTTKKKGLFGLWGKTVTTTWKETQGMLTAYNFGLKADNKIGIEFTGNANGSTGTITSNGNILLGGDIHMGQIDITSTGGSISHLGDAAVVSDNAKFNANTGIDIIQKNVKDALHLNAVTNTGNINIKAIAANANSDVYIDNVKTGGKGTKQGAVNITAEGSILNGAGEGAHVTGDSITLRSYNGSIGADKEMLIIDGGEAGTNAYAAKNINITEANGNMYLGEIVAENGDVVLEVKESGAGFVDAIVDNSKADANNRLDEWKKLGLLGGDSEAANSQDNQKTGLKNTAENGSLFLDENTTLPEAQQKGKDLLAAGEKFVDLMKGGSDSVQAARKDMNEAKGKLNEAIAELSDSAASKEAYKNALDAYNAAYEKYAEAGAAYDKAKDEFIANSGFAENERAAQWLKSYEAVGNADTDNYGWTENQLLYAVQDSVINPTAGSIGDVQTANVTGNNITFISDTGNIGVVDDQTTIIATKKLSGMFTRKGDLTADEQAKLEKLAGARAGDVTWGDENITIKRTTPVSVKLNGNSDGKVTVKNTSGATADHIYLLAKDSRLTADEFAANDLRLSGQQGLDINKVTGEKIYLEGGSGDIGSGYGEALKDMQVTLNNGGYVNANAAGNIKLSQAGTGNFTIGSIAGENVDITANGSIVSKSDDIGYINAGDTINLISKEGGVGSADAGLRIKNSGAVVNTNVQGAVNIEAKQDGTLVLGAIKQTDGGVNVESEGSILVGRTDDTTTTDKDESVEGYIDSKGDVNLHADENIEINGKLHVNGGEGSLKLHADNGNITQTATSAEKNIETGRLDMAAVGGSIDLGNKHNVIGKVDIHGLGGGMNLNVSNKGLEIDLGGVDNKLGGDVHIGNETGDVHITTNDIAKDGAQDEANINGNLYVKAQGSGSDIKNSGVLNATGTLEFNAKDGSITSNTVSGKDVIMNAITQELEKITSKDSVNFTGDKIHAGTVEQDKSAAGNLTVNTDSSSGGAIGSMNIDELKANDKSVFTDLWTKTAKINTPNSKIDFNKLNVENKVQITTSETSVNVHGPKPGAKDPSADVELWKRRPQNMFVNIDGREVTTNADILSLKDYYYVYDQRFTVENYMRFMLNDTIEDVYDIEGDYSLVYYNRYYNYDLPEMAQNADEDELVIESEKV